MFKTRFISMLVLLAAVATGAMAQTETLLTTMHMDPQHTSLTGDGGDTVGLQLSLQLMDIPSPNVYSMTTPIVLLQTAKLPL